MPSPLASSYNRRRTAAYCFSRRWCAWYVCRTHTGAQIHTHTSTLLCGVSGVPELVVTHRNIDLPFVVACMIRHACMCDTRDKGSTRRAPPASFHFFAGHLKETFGRKIAKWPQSCANGVLDHVCIISYGSTFTFLEAFLLPAEA